MGSTELVLVAVLLGAIWWILASVAVCMAAEKRGRERGPWFFLSLFLGPVFVVLVLIAYPPEKRFDGAA